MVKLLIGSLLIAINLHGFEAPRSGSVEIHLPTTPASFSPESDTSGDSLGGNILFDARCPGHGVAVPTVRWLDYKNDLNEKLDVLTVALQENGIGLDSNQLPASPRARIDFMAAGCVKQAAKNTTIATQVAAKARAKKSQDCMYLVAGSVVGITVTGIALLGLQRYLNKN